MGHWIVSSRWSVSDSSAHLVVEAMGGGQVQAETNALQNQEKHFSEIGEMSRDEEERKRLCWTIACRAEMAFRDGYFTADEFSHLLWELGLLTEFKQEKRA